MMREDLIAAIDRVSRNRSQFLSDAAASALRLHGTEPPAPKRARTGGLRKSA